jgi:hypothetical protein
LLLLEFEIIDVEVLPNYIEQFKILTKALWSNDTIKSIATYLINTLPKSSDFNEIEPSTSCTNIEPINLNNLKKYHVRFRCAFLNMLFEIIEENNESRKYADEIINTLTPRWIFLFLAENLEENTIALGTRLLFLMYFNADTARIKLKEFLVVLPKLISQRHCITGVYIPLWAMICGSTCNLKVNLPYDADNIITILELENAPQCKAGPCLEIFRSIAQLLKSSFQEIIHRFSNQGELKGETIALGKVTMSNLKLMSKLYRKYLPFKDILYRQEAIDDIMSLLFAVLSTKPANSTELEMSGENFDEEGANNDMRLDFTNDTSLQEANFLENAFSIQNESRNMQNLNSKIYIHSISKISNLQKSFIDILLEIIVNVAIDSIVDSEKTLVGIDYILKAQAQLTKGYSSNY